MPMHPFLPELSENQILIQDTIREFAEKNIRPVIMEYDESQKFPMEIMHQLGELGFMGILVPEEYGGGGLGYIEYALIIEELAKIDPSIALSVAAHNGLCTNHINLFGNEDQKRKYLPNLASGKKIGAWGLTEAASGSDAAGLKSVAVKEDGYWILNGNKQFTTHGTVGETYVVIAITNKDAGKKGISAFILEKGFEGLIIGKKENKLGMRSSDTTQLAFENCKVPEENLLGQNSLSLIIAVYIILKLHQRLRLFPRWQQSVVVLMLTFINQLIGLWIRTIIGSVPERSDYWMPVLTTPIFWPWVFFVLRDLRRRFLVG